MLHAGIAQLVEYKLPKLGVAGSNPVARSTPDRLLGNELEDLQKPGEIIMRSRKTDVCLLYIFEVRYYLVH